MSESQQPIRLMVAQSIASRAIDNWRFVSLWILLRCFPKRRFYKLVPTAFLISAVLSFVSAVSFLGSLAIFASKLGWTISTVLLIVGLVYRQQIRGLGSIRIRLVAAVLALIPNAYIGWPIQISLCLLNCLFALLGKWEKHASLSQFSFKPFSLKTINEGSATILRGEVHVVHLFVDSNEFDPWHPNQKRAVRKNANKALNWLVQQARRYKVNVQFAKHSIQAQPTWQSRIPKSCDGDEAHREFGKWILEPMKQFLESQSIPNDANICFLVYVKDYDCNYAIRQMKFLNPTCSYEYAMIASPHSASVVAHELLHLFGADDYYLGAYFQRDCQEPAIRKQLLDGCIMFNVTDDIADSYVDDLTAQNIGWL